jgi:uncharacterized protein YaaQ
VKLMMVILNNNDADEVIKELISEEYRVTRIASTGGFLRRGNTTLLVGTDVEKIDRAIEIIKETSVEPTQPGQRRATVFVLDVTDYTQL